MQDLKKLKDLIEALGETSAPEELIQRQEELERRKEQLATELASVKVELASVKAEIRIKNGNLEKVQAALVKAAQGAGIDPKDFGLDPEVVRKKAKSPKGGKGKYLEIKVLTKEGKTRTYSRPANALYEHTKGMGGSNSEGRWKVSELERTLGHSIHEKPWELYLEVTGDTMIGRMVDSENLQ